MVCKKCNYEGEMKIEKKGPHEGYFCPKCGAWQKWMNKSEKESINMSFNFGVNYDEAFEGSGLMAEGTYEVLVVKAAEDVTKNGTEHINMHLVVRNDIDQKYKNKYVFHSMFKGKQTGQYHSGILNTIAKALQIQNGKKFDSLDALLKDFVGKTAKITIKHEEYNGNTNERVKAWEPSKFTTCNHQFKDKVDNGFIAVNDTEDIPF